MGIHAEFTLINDGKYENRKIRTSGCRESVRLINRRFPVGFVKILILLQTPDLTLQSL